MVSGAGWNNTLAAKGTVAFGFVATPRASPTSPTNYMLNGQSLGGGGSTPPALPSINVADVTFERRRQRHEERDVFTVTLSAAATSRDRQLRHAQWHSAPSGSDYTAASGKLTFSAGQTSKTVNVAVLGDSIYEPDETFFLDLSAASGATLARSTATGTITNDDPAPPPPTNPASGLPATITFTNTNDWGNGFNGDVAIKNTGTGTIRGWKLQFTFAGNDFIDLERHRSSAIPATRMSCKARVGTPTSPRAQSVDFGFTGSPGGASAVLSQFRAVRHVG